MTPRQKFLVVLAMIAAAGLGFSIRASGIHEPPPPPPASAVPVEHDVTGYVAGPEQPCQSSTCEKLPYWNWLIPTGTICVEVRGSTYATQAALDLYYNTDAKTLPARSNCYGYPRTNVIKLVPKDLGTGACAMTSGTAWHDENVRGVVVKVLDDPTIWYNTNAALQASCFGNAFAAKHVWSHELEHAVGLKHNWGIASNVASKPPAGSGIPDYSWKFDHSTAWDRAEINRRY